jgi:hypothetical protein
MLMRANAKWMFALAAAFCSLLASGISPAQVRQDRAGESKQGARPGTPSPDEIGRSEQITGTASGAVSLSDEQRQKVRQYFTAHKDARNDQPSVPVTIGAAVPKQVELKDLPKDVTDALQKYFGDGYFFAGDRLVIVEPKVRRIVAVIPNIE